jgi:hypothetical protein
MIIDGDDSKCNNYNNSNSSNNNNQIIRAEYIYDLRIFSYRIDDELFDLFSILINEIHSFTLCNPRNDLRYLGHQ